MIYRRMIIAWSIVCTVHWRKYLVWHICTLMRMYAKLLVVHWNRKYIVGHICTLVYASSKLSCPQCKRIFRGTSYTIIPSIQIELHLPPYDPIRGDGKMRHAHMTLLPLAFLLLTRQGQLSYTIIPSTHSSPLRYFSAACLLQRLANVLNQGAATDIKRFHVRMRCASAILIIICLQ